MASATTAPGARPIGSQRSLLAVNLGDIMARLTREAKVRMQLSPGRPSKKGSTTPEDLFEQPKKRTHAGEAVTHLAKLTGIGTAFAIGP